MPKYPDLMENYLYVDNLVTGTNDIEHAFDLYKAVPDYTEEFRYVPCASTS